MLEVRGGDKTASEEAFTTISNAIKRGGTEGKRYAFVLSAVVASTILIMNVALFSGNYLFDLGLGDLVYPAVDGVTTILGGVFGIWAYPLMEVAPPMQTRLWRMAKFLGPVVIGLIVGGVTKLIFE